MENHYAATTIDAESIIMNDHCVSEVLKHLNFNEKSKCRLVSHQFKRVIDSYVTKTLVRENIIHITGLHHWNAND